MAIFTMKVVLSVVYSDFPYGRPKKKPPESFNIYDKSIDWWGVSPRTTMELVEFLNGEESPIDDGKACTREMEKARDEIIKQYPALGLLDQDLVESCRDSIWHSCGDPDSINEAVSRFISHYGQKLGETLNLNPASSLLQNSETQ